MFSKGHFIWLGIIALFIVLFLFLSKKFKPSHDLIRRIVFFLLVPLKIFHMSLSLKESSHGGFIIDQPQLSFHLCSIMIYAVILINLIPNEKFVKTMKSFMVPCMLLGAAMALLIPTEGVDPATPRVWQYMLIHGVLVFYGLYLAIVEKVDLSIKAYLTNLKLLLAVAVLAFLMNSVLGEYGTNFLFLREPPMDNLPVLNMNNGWGVYLITLALITCILLFSVHLPYIIKNSKKNKDN